MKPDERRCPDDGYCHHECARGCFRVLFCEPLSNIFDGDRWPAEIKQAHVALGVEHSIEAQILKD
jgi:hypothetical protein